ncbi:MAG TPA: response regulator [Stellaceae bacterium]|nr:response regulator [Stellaceae bacterium]
MQKILIIDDDSLVRDTLLRILQRKGYEVLVAADGRHGVQTYRRENPDLVITDLIMPEKEGLETIREIRSTRSDAKIIAISGGARLGNMDYLEMAGKLGASEIIAKPFDPSELITLVSRCLNG